MNKKLSDAAEMIANVQHLIVEANDELSSNKSVFKLAELSSYIDVFCKKTGTTKAEICMFSGISKSTLTAALKRPEKASMATITAIGSVVGLDVLLGRKHD